MRETDSFDLKESSTPVKKAGHMCICIYTHVFKVVRVQGCWELAFQFGFKGCRLSAPNLLQIAAMIRWILKILHDPKYSKPWE